MFMLIQDQLAELQRVHPREQIVSRPCVLPPLPYADEDSRTSCYQGASVALHT